MVNRHKVTVGEGKPSSRVSDERTLRAQTSQRHREISTLVSCRYVICRVNLNPDLLQRGKYSVYNSFYAHCTMN